MGIPTWILLLLLLPLSGAGVLPCFFGASLLAAGVVIWADRRHARREGGATPRPADTPRSPMSPLAAAGLTLGAVVLVLYIVFVFVSNTH